MTTEKTDANRNPFPRVEGESISSGGGLLVRVVGPSFVAGLVLDDRGVCRLAAPILRRLCLGRSRAELRQVFRARGWAAKILR